MVIIDHSFGGLGIDGLPKFIMKILRQLCEQEGWRKEEKILKDTFDIKLYDAKMHLRFFNLLESLKVLGIFMDTPFNLSFG